MSCLRQEWVIRVSLGAVLSVGVQQVRRGC